MPINNNKSHNYHRPGIQLKLVGLILFIIASGIVITILLKGPAGLFRLASPHNILVGTAVSGWQLDDREFVSTLTREFNLVTPENAMKFEVLSPAPGVYDFTEADKIVQFAQQHGLSVRGHTLVWTNQLPVWLINGNYSHDELVEILHNHIKTVVGHYRGQVKYWDVVNEGLDNNGNIAEDNFWMQKIGPEYISLAFQWAHEADPDAVLIYNESHAEAKNPKADGVFTLAQTLKAQGIPIHGIGFEMHTGVGWSPAPQEFAENLRRLDSIGLDAHITEMDVRIEEPVTPGELQQQANIYARIFEVCLEMPNCTVFSTWGLTDAHSWIPDVYPGTGSPLLFFADYSPKPAYYALIDVLEGKPKP